MNREEKLAELHALQQKAAAIESQLAADAAETPNWPPKNYYTAYHLLAGMTLGLVGAGASLLFNIVGSAWVSQHPLELIRVYLTFPLGEKALTVDGGVALVAGCCLYLGTGMILGIPFHMVLTRFFNDASAAKRFSVATTMGIALWLVNYYGILSWLQPALVDGRAWIVEKTPFYVAAATHVVFGWTMLALNRAGRFTPPATIATAAA